MSWEIGLIIASSVASATSQVVSGWATARQGQIESQIAIKQASQDRQVSEIDALQAETERLKDFRIYQADMLANNNFEDAHILAMHKDAYGEVTADINRIRTRASVAPKRLGDTIEIAKYSGKTARTLGYSSVLKAGGTLMQGGYKAEKIRIDRKKD